MKRFFINHNYKFYTKGINYDSKQRQLGNTISKFIITHSKRSNKTEK